jgi:hypothetical protein
MEIIPLIHLKKRRILGKEISLKDLLNRIKDIVYILDMDGIEKNKPNFDFYQKLSRYRKIWVDCGPRYLGDVVDAVMAGAVNVTIRRNHWKEGDLSGIKEIAEIDISIDADLREVQTFDADNLVVFLDREEVEGDFKFSSSLKNLCIRHRVYVYEPKLENLSYWKGFGIKGLLKDVVENGGKDNYSLPL